MPSSEGHSDECDRGVGLRSFLDGLFEGPIHGATLASLIIMLVAGFVLGSAVVSGTTAGVLVAFALVALSLWNQPTAPTVVGDWLDDNEDEGGERRGK